MITLLNRLFEREPIVNEENESHFPVPAGLRPCDSFGRVLTDYLRQFPSPELQKVLPALFELGRSTHPTHDWNHFKKYAHWPQHDQSLRNILDDWWNVLQRVVAEARHSSRTGKVIPGDCCPLLRYHLPLARAIVWLQLHHQGKRMVPSLLQFMSDCLAKYPNCPEITQQLAQSAANMLVREDYFALWQHQIAFQYPELMRGRIGKRIRGGVRRAS